MQSKNDLLEGELISDIPYGDRAYIAYDLGTWAVAYLISIAGLDSYREDFYNDLNQYGWEGSFSINFGLSPSEFLVSFHEFLDLDINEQLSILPWILVGPWFLYRFMEYYYTIYFFINK